MPTTLLSVQKTDSESLINKVDEQIRVIKSLSPTPFTLDNLYDELAIIRTIPQSFDNVVRTISVLDKFDKQSVIQSLRNMDQTCSNLSGTSSAFSAASAPSKSRLRASAAPNSSPSTQNSQSGTPGRPKCPFFCFPARFSLLECRHWCLSYDIPSSLDAQFEATSHPDSAG